MGREQRRTFKTHLKLAMDAFADVTSKKDPLLFEVLLKSFQSEWEVDPAGSFTCYSCEKELEVRDGCTYDRLFQQIDIKRTVVAMLEAGESVDAHAVATALLSLKSPRAAPNVVLKCNGRRRACRNVFRGRVDKSKLHQHFYRFRLQ